MEKFIKAYKAYINLKKYSPYYRFCWIPYDNCLGLYSSIEFFDDEINKIDKKKCEIILF